MNKNELYDLMHDLETSYRIVANDNDRIKLSKYHDTLNNFIIEYEIKEKQLEDIRNYIIQSDLDKMLWGKELMKILDREEK